MENIDCKPCAEWWSAADHTCPKGWTLGESNESLVAKLKAAELQKDELEAQVTKWRGELNGAERGLAEAMHQNSEYRKALLEIRAKLVKSHDGGCILPLRDMVNDALGEGYAKKREDEKVPICDKDYPFGEGNYSYCCREFGHDGPCGRG